MINYTIKSNTGLCAGKMVLVAIGASQYELGYIRLADFGQHRTQCRDDFKLIPGASHMNIRRKNLRERKTKQKYF